MKPRPTAPVLFAPVTSCWLARMVPAMLVAAVLSQRDEGRER